MPFPPGSTLDVLTRIVADQLAQKWAQPVVVENISGGGGNIGTERFARSTPDGYTLLFAPPGPFTINPLLFKDVNFDPAKFVADLPDGQSPECAADQERHRRGLGAGTDHACARPIRASSPMRRRALVRPRFLAAKLLEARAGIAMVHVPYRGAGPALNDIVAGHVDMMFDTIVTSLPLHRAGKARILAVANDERSRALPDVPTIAETVPGFRSASWFAVAAPPERRPAIADKVSRDIAELIRKPEVNAKLRELQLDPVGSAPAEAVAFFNDETALWSKVIKDAGVTPQ